MNNSHSAILSPLTALFAGALFLISCNLSNLGGSTEAEQEAEKYWNQYLTKCEDSYVASSSTGQIGGLFVYQWKPAKIVVTPAKLEEADKLNGIDWKGTTVIAAELHRVYQVGKWGDWSAAMFNPSASFHKRNGKWTLPSAPVSRFKKIDCGTLPK